MLRGFRWQFVALVLAIILFIISLLSRSSSDTPVGEPTLTPNGQTSNAISSATVTPLTEIIATTAPITPLPITDTSSDGVVTYSEALIGNVQRLNPLFASLNPVDKDITSLIFEGLTRINEYGEPVPNLAVNWVVSSDELE